MIKLRKVTAKQEGRTLLLTGMTIKESAHIFEQLKRRQDWSVELRAWGITRSTAISDRFHGWITYMARESGVSRDTLYVMVLKRAIEVVADGGNPYPYTIVDGVAYPHRTRDRTNKEMMTACFAAELVAAEDLELQLPEGAM